MFFAAAMNRVLEDRAFEPYSVEAYKGLVGDGIEEMVRRADKAKIAIVGIR